MIFDVNMVDMRINLFIGDVNDSCMEIFVVTLYMFKIDVVLFVVFWPYLALPKYSKRV